MNNFNDDTLVNDVQKLLNIYKPKKIQKEGIADLIREPIVHQYLQALILEQDFEINENLSFKLENAGLIEKKSDGRYGIQETGRLFVLAYCSLVSV